MTSTSNDVDAPCTSLTPAPCTLCSSGGKASWNLEDPDDAPPAARTPEAAAQTTAALTHGGVDELLGLNEQLSLNLRSQLEALELSLSEGAAVPAATDEEQARVELLVKLRGLVEGIKSQDSLASLCALAERLEGQESERGIRIGSGVAARYISVSRATVRQRFESDSPPGRALEIGEEIDVLESRVNARDQLRVRFGGGWASVTASDGATLLAPIEVVKQQPKLYRVLNRVTIRVGADASSSSVGTLEVGEFVTVLETRKLESGQLRARFQFTLQKTRLGRDGGWTSINTTDGERMMECIQDKTAGLPEGIPTSARRGAPQPEPEPEPEPKPKPLPQPEPELEPAADDDDDDEDDSDDESVDMSSSDSESDDSDDSDDTPAFIVRPNAPVAAKASSPKKAAVKGSDSSEDDGDSSDDSSDSDTDSEEEDEDDELGALDAGPSRLAPINRDEINARGGGRRRNSVSAESTSDMMKSTSKLLSSLPKTDAQKAAITNAIAGNILFSNMDDDTRAKVYESMFQQTCGPGKSEVIIKQGDEGAEYFYVVEAGNCSVMVNDEQVTTLGPGQSFGELALMYFSPRAATVIALEPTTLWVMDRVTFRAVLLSSGNRKREDYKRFLTAVPLCNNLSEYDRNKVAEVLEEVSYTAGENIITQDDSADAM